MAERTRQSHRVEWLKARGYDGLFAATPDGMNCGCSVQDFAPCGEGPFPECVPAELCEDGLFYRAPSKSAAVVVR